MAAIGRVNAVPVTAAPAILENGLLAATGTRMTKQVATAAAPNAHHARRRRHVGTLARAGTLGRFALALAMGSTLLAMAPGATAPAFAQQRSGAVIAIEQGDAVQQVRLGLDKSLVIDLPSDAFDILVANPGVADAVTRSSRRIYLFGREVGETNVFVFGENGEPIANLDIRVERDIASLEADIERFVPGSDVQVEIVNDNIVLTGEVLTPQDATKAQQLASIFLNGGEQGSRGQGETGGTFNLFDGVDQTSSIVNLITILGENQVTLKLTIAEIQRSVLKQLGVDFTGSLNASVLNGDNFQFNGAGFNTPGQYSGGMATASGSSFGLGGRIGSNELGVSFNATVRALNQAGVMRTLAEPSLTAVSGEQATFSVGGSYNVVNSVDISPGETVVNNGTVIRTPPETTIGQTSIPYGVSLNFRPIVLSSGRISISLATSVREPTATGNQPGANGVTALTLREREVTTTVEMPSGGSFAIAGLIRDDIRQTIAKTPGLGNIPIFGSLFRSRAFSREETELVIIATPYLVRPVARTELQRPDDNFQPENDTKANLLGRVNRIYGNRNSPKGPYHGSIGFIYK